MFSLSRSKVIPLFREKKIFVGGRVYENNSGILKEDDVVSVRGYGKIIYKLYLSWNDCLETKEKILKIDF